MQNIFKINLLKYNYINVKTFFNDLGCHQVTIKIK